MITLAFRDGIENYWSCLRINERIQNVTLPPGITAGLDPVTSPTGIYYYTLESDTKGQRELPEIQRWTVIPALKQVLGVADVSNFNSLRSSQYPLASRKYLSCFSHTTPGGRESPKGSRRMKARLAELPAYEPANPSLTALRTRFLKLAARIYGDDFNERRRVGSDVAKALRATPGTIEVLVDDRLPLPDWNRRWSRKPAL